MTMGSVVREAAKWALARAESISSFREASARFEIRRADLVPMVDNTVRRLLYFDECSTRSRMYQGMSWSVASLYGESSFCLASSLRDEGRLRKIWALTCSEPLSS